MQQQNEWEIFVHNITWLRTHHGISKKRMAALLGICVSSLNAIESGRMPPRLSVEIFFHIYDSFGVHPAAQLTKQLSEKDEF